MDKLSAIILIKDTLQNSFNKEQFLYFIKNLLNHVEETPTTIYRGNLIPDAYKSYIQMLERICKYRDPKGNKIDVLIIHLKKETSLEQARTMQRNFIALYLNGSRGGVLKDAAIVAFVSPDKEDWRFSFVKMEYKLTETPKGTIKAREEFTPAKRYSFLVGKNENSHTAQSRLVPLLLDDEHNPSLKEIEDAFSIEKVTKEFFEKYRELFLRTKDALDEIVEKDIKIKNDFTKKGVDTVDFVKKLLGQIVFLYFLQKKGWFGVERDADWGTGPKNFLRILFEKKIADYKNLFNDILEPLFYEALASERTDDFYSRFNCKIPFLNGGLFDPINNYDWVHTDILLPNELFSNEIKTKEGDIGTGILDVFDRYNFTVKEDEPLEKEVAVDPEMLGKVFENLLEVKDRKSKGTYYTPREIVHYMCQESLINFLDEAINSGKEYIVQPKTVQKKLIGEDDPEQLGMAEKKTIIPREDIESFIKYGVSTIEHDKRIESKGYETRDYSYKMPSSIRLNARLFDDALRSIKVCDPAIGSGAFPVAMMHEIVKARETLTTYINENKERTPYNFKRHAIQNCLYGVDIDPGAVEIAKLRLWLSLIVDEEDIRHIKPLPNLDFKIVCGNSLLGVNALFHHNQIKTLEKLKEQYFEETNQRKKTNLKQEIDNLIKEITNKDERFDFNVYFSEVFHKMEGFDVVIANPPYMGERKNKEVFLPIQKGNLKEFYLGRMDYFYFFIHLALNIGKMKSTIAFITTNYYLTALGAKKLREDLRNRATILKLINFNELKIFESASGQHSIITIMTKSSNREKLADTCITNVIGLGTTSVLNEILSWKHKTSDYFRIPQKDLWEGEESYLRITGNVNFTTNPIQLVLAKLSTASQKRNLGDLCNTLIGLESSLDKVFIVHKDVIKNIIENDNERDYFKPFYKNSDIEKYYTKSATNHFILYVHEKIDNITNLRGIWTYLNTHKKELSARKGANLRGAYRRGNWWVLNTPRLDMNFDGEKIITPYRTRTARFAYNDYPWYASRDVYFITKKNPSIDLKYILALLNSRLYFLWFYNKGKRKGEMIEMYSKPLSEIPIQKISEEKQQPFIEIVDKILAITKSDDYIKNNIKQAKVREYERQIDKMVYELYDLTPEEIEIVEEKK